MVQSDHLQNSPDFSIQPVLKTCCKWSDWTTYTKSCTATIIFENRTDCILRYTGPKFGHAQAAARVSRCPHRHLTPPPSHKSPLAGLPAPHTPESFAFPRSRHGADGPQRRSAAQEPSFQARPPILTLFGTTVTGVFQGRIADQQLWSNRCGGGGLVWA